MRRRLDECPEVRGAYQGPRSVSAAAIELARRHPGFAQACRQELQGAAEERFIQALMSRPAPLKPIKKAGPERYRPTELSIQLRVYSKLAGG